MRPPTVYDEESNAIAAAFRMDWYASHVAGTARPGFVALRPHKRQV